MTTQELRSPGRRWLAWLAAAGRAAARGLRLVGSQCCAGRAATAWQLTRDRDSEDRRPGPE
ncbi:MAG: hypothetical protein ACLQFR_26555 [Streptosporangiaceae bacterium]